MIKIVSLQPSDTKTSALIDRWCLEEDYDYASRFKKKQRKVQSLSARALLRLLSAVYFCKKGTNLGLITRPSGYLDVTTPDTQLYASISHSTDLVCVALSDHCPIGLDIEDMTSPRDLSMLIRNFYADFTGSQQDAYRFWTLLEAYGKAKGDGLDLADAPFIDDVLSGKASLAHKSMIKNDHMITLCAYVASP